VASRDSLGPGAGLAARPPATRRTDAEPAPRRPIQPDRLLTFTWSSSYPHYREFASHREVFAGVVATSGEPRLSVSIDGITELTEAAFVSANAFGVLGVPAAAGRTFVESDDTGLGGPVVGMLSHDYWSARFGQDPRVIGKLIRGNDRPVTIVGVAAEGFRGTTLFSNPDIYLPITSSPVIRTGFMSKASLLDHAGFVWLNVICRLGDGITPEQAASARAFCSPAWAAPWGCSWPRRPCGFSRRSRFPAESRSAVWASPSIVSSCCGPPG